MLISLGVIVVVVVIALFVLSAKKQINSTVTNSQPTEAITAKFICQEGKQLQAKFNSEPESSVELVLSDGRTLQLPRAISASGARYANADETIVFWNKGDTAFLEENGVSTFQDCLVKEN